MKNLVLFSVFVLFHSICFGQSCSISSAEFGETDSLEICQNDIVSLFALNVVGLNPSDTVWIVNTDSTVSDIFEPDCTSEGSFWVHLLVIDSSDVNNVLTCSDSIFIFVLPIDNVTDTQFACDQYEWIDGITYSTSNNSALWTLTNSSGCDSLVTLDLTIGNSNTGTDVQTDCGSYTWIDGNTYTTSNNSATHTLINASGCDSLVTLDLIINNAVTGTEAITACASFTWIDGETYTESNTATYIIEGGSQFGCDSIVTLNLTINDVYVDGKDTMICETELPFTWYGIEFDEAGEGVIVLQSIGGCDSIIELNLQTQAIGQFPSEIVIQEGSGAQDDDGVICLGDEAVLNVQSIPGGNYLWSNGETLPFIIVSPNADTEYTLTYSYGVCTADEISTVLDVDLLSTGSSISGTFEDLCMGASEVDYYVNFTPNCSYQWSVNGGYFQGLSNGTNVSVNWLNEFSSITLTISDSITGCTETYTEPVSFNQDNIPELLVVTLLDASLNLLVTENNPTYPFYTWGSRHKINAMDVLEYNTDAPYHSFDDLDTINRYYYVKHGNDLECMQTSYYNPPENLGMIENTIDEIVLYPNPVVNYVELQNMDDTKDYIIHLFNSDGRLLETVDINQINVYRLEYPFLPGTYLLKLSSQKSMKTFRFVVF